MAVHLIEIDGIALISNDQETRSTDLFPTSRFCVCTYIPNRNLTFLRCNVVIFFVFDGLTSDVVVRFVDIGDIDDHLT